MSVNIYLFSDSFTLSLSLGDQVQLKLPFSVWLVPHFAFQRDIAELCHSIFQRQIALYSPCRWLTTSPLIDGYLGGSPLVPLRCPRVPWQGTPSGAEGTPYSLELFTLYSFEIIFHCHIFGLICLQTKRY